MRFVFPLCIRGVLVCLFLGVIAETGCGGGSVSSSQKQSSSPAAAPSIILSAQPNSITSGTTAVLNWSSSNAANVTIAGLGTFGASGSVSVTPSATTTYTAVANGPGGSANANTTVSVTATPTPGPGPNPPPPPPPPAAGVPVFSHVFLLVEENHGYSSVIGNSAMPYLNSLASQYGLATQYYANTHPSIGNYFMLTTGQILTNDDSFSGTENADNIVRHLLTAGKTWKSYAESLPGVGYTGGNSGAYLQRHNPFSFFTDVVNSATQKNNLVPFTQFATDLQNNTLPEFSFIVPNALDDGHDASLNQADSWLKQHIGPLISSAAFQNSLLVIVFDEAETSDAAHGGGHVAALVVSPKAKKAYQSTTLYQHQSTLRLILEGLGIQSFPGAAASATNPAEFF